MKTHAGKLLIAAAFTLLVIGLISWVTPVGYYRMAINNEFLKSIKEKIENFNAELPEDRVYLHFDKPFYEPGETIWFSAYVRNGSDIKPSKKSDIIHIELIGPKGNIEKQIKLIAKNGQAPGDFQLSEDVAGGIYKIKAYTNWQKNETSETFFEKELTVQNYILPALKMKLDFERKAFGPGDEVFAKVNLNTNENKPLSNYKFKYVASLNGEKLPEKSAETDNEGTGYFRFKLPKDLKTSDGLLNVLIDYQGSTESVSRSIPIVLNKIKFEMFPEGGDLVAGLPSKVAFRALNEFDKPADVEGTVVTSKGNTIANFSSFHMGTGAFDLKPQKGEKYFVKITKPEGINETFELPEVLKRGYVLNIDAPNTNEITATIHTSETEELSLAAQVRGKIYHLTAFNAVPGPNKIIIPTGKFPIGVSQITLFDSKGIARAERLAFVNKDKKLDISVTTDKEKYLPREKVKMTISVKDERGLPMPADLSLSVANDQLLSFADDRTGNIISKLLLEQDIKDKVEEPGFYFDNKEAKADKALDYLLMTSGWRRFTWEQVRNNSLPYAKFLGEQAVITGVVYDAAQNKPVAKANVTVGNIKVTTNEKGEYIFKNIEPNFPVAIQISANGYSASTQYAYDYVQNQFTYLYNPGYYDYRDRAYPSAANEKAGNRNFKNKAGNIPQVAEIPMAMNMRAVENNAVIADAEFLAEEIQAAHQQLKAKKDKVHKAEAEVIVEDKRMKRIAAGEVNARLAQNTSYYRVRQFAAPIYDKKQNVEVRTDFRSTIYWNGNIEIGSTGKKTIEFYNSDDISSFRATVEGISDDGMIGRTETVYYTQLPFSMSTKVPVEVVSGDIISIPLTLINNTTEPLGGIMNVIAPAGLEAINKIPPTQTIMPGKAKTIYLDYKVSNNSKPGEFTLSFKSCGLADAFTQKIKIVSKGFPVTASLSGQDLEKEFSINPSHVVDGSLKATLTAYPSVVNDLLSGIEGILREPGGCFEQTSMSSYPNAMVLDYLKTTETKDDKTLSRAIVLLDKGYNRLTSFETKEKGYEWFGAAPGHEALTAYGLMQFADMKRVGGNVSDKMMDRTAQWLMSRRDGKGGFLRNDRALDNFGRGSEDITNAYIVYSLAEAGYKDIQKEADQSYKKALENKDPYMLSMMANAMYSLGDVKRGDNLMSILYPKQDKTGSFTGNSHSITHSTGQSLIIETTSLAIMAMVKQSDKNQEALTKAVKCLVGSRSGYGTFGNTQGTVLALKALTNYAKASKKTSTGGTIEFYVNGKKTAEQNYAAGEKGNIEIAGLEKYLKEGKQNIAVKFKGTKEPLPYSLAVSWNTSLPNSLKESAIHLITKLSTKTANVGETVRLTSVIKNTKNEAVASPIAIIGIPAGFTVQPWQLKEMQEKKMFDYYELTGNNIVLYYRGMNANEVKNINFDLKAEIPGEYDAPASSGYLYYTNEYKSWSGLDKVVIKKKV